MLTVCAIPVLVIGIIPFMLSFYGDFQMGVSYTALFGFFLYGAFALAAGLFFSSLTESPVIAAILTFIVLFLGYLMTGIRSMISQTGNLVTDILSVRRDVGGKSVCTVRHLLCVVCDAVFILYDTIHSEAKRQCVE